jgi:pyruvate-ferredoxin/flavodoxin oxidoreductase
MLCSSNVQEAMDFALIAQASTLRSRIPFLHFFDGFRTSHELQKIEELTFDDMRAMIDDDLIREARGRGLTPDRPMVRGTAQNPDVFFQGRETVNLFQAATPGIVQEEMKRFRAVAGRSYHLFDYYGVEDAERLVVVMGSAGETVMSTVRVLNERGERLGLLQVRLFRPFDVTAFVKAIPASVKRIAVLDRTKEPGSIGEPLYLDVRTAIGEAAERDETNFKEYPSVVGGRYGLGSKDFSPAMAKAVFDNLAQGKPKNDFTVGIIDDVSNTSLEIDESFSIEGKAFRGMFFGLGADGTVGANKATIKIIGKETDNYAQGYFVYDSKKSGAVTISHLRFGEEPIQRPYLLTKANFIACHNPAFLRTYDMLAAAEDGGTFLLMTSQPPESVWDTLPAETQRHLIDKKMKFYIIDAVSIAEDLGLGARVNIIMQTAFFIIAGIIPKHDAIRAIREQLQATYKSKGEHVVKMNYESVERAVNSIVEIPMPAQVTGQPRRGPVTEDAPPFVKDVVGPMILLNGDKLPVSAMPPDGRWPTNTTQYEKRNIAVHIPIWEPEVCIQCGLCSFACPHSTIRMKAYDPGLLSQAPTSFKCADARGKELKGLKFTVQVAPEDCTGCAACVYVCPAHKKDQEGKRIPDFKAINMWLNEPFREREAENYAFFLSLPETDPARYDRATVKGSQFALNLFEYHSACAGCGETPYIRFLTQLFGDRLLIGDATGCTSIYSGNLPTIPYAKRRDGRGPAWCNSLFEDNAEFGFGMMQTVEKFREQALEQLARLSERPDYALQKTLFDAIRNADISSPAAIDEQRARIEELKKLIARDASREAKELLSLADYLVKKSVWAIGGDGWAYDIGYDGVDHVLASRQDINILILDTEVYSNTGGQMSKATPLSAVAEFAAGGKRTPKKDIALIMTTYGYVYVAQVAYGANPIQTIKALLEAEAYDGPSLVVAYSTCIAQGIDMSRGVEENRKAVACGHWPLFRFNPLLETQGKNPFVLDSPEPSIPFREYAYGENRFRRLRMSNPELAEKLIQQAQKDVERRWSYLKHLAAWQP